MDAQYDLIIVGAGPAGMTAGVYGARGGLNVLMLEPQAPGGKLVKTFEICNWPGYQTITGVQLAMDMFDHATSAGTQYAYGQVKQIKPLNPGFEVICDDQTYTSKAVILATGTVEKTLDLEGEAALIGRGVSFCAVCDGAFYKDKVVTVIGGGNSALEEAVYLTQFASKVYIVIRRDVFRADPAAVKTVENNPKIEVIVFHVPHEYQQQDGKVSGLVLKHVHDGSLKTIETDAVFPYIGQIPATESVVDLDVVNKDGYLLVNEKMETAIPGLFGAGDVCDKPLRQIVTATSDGAVAAQQAFHYIQQHFE